MFVLDIIAKIGVAIFGVTTIIMMARRINGISHWN